MLQKQEFDTTVAQVLSDYDQSKEIRLLLKGVIFDPLLVATPLFGDESKKMRFLALFTRIHKEMPLDWKNKLSESLEKIFQEQKQSRVWREKMTLNEDKKLTRPKINTLLSAFDLFENLTKKYEQDEWAKNISKFLMTNAEKIRSIVNHSEVSKEIAREDGDYENLSSLELSLRDLQKSDFFAHTLKSTRDIHALYQNYRRGSIIETPYVREKIDEVMESLEGDIPQPVMLIWVHGAGKTELARHISRTRFGVEAIEIPGSEDLDKRDFEGRYKLEAADLEGFVHFLDSAGIKQVTLAGQIRQINSWLVSEISTNPHLRVELENEIARVFVEHGEFREAEKKEKLEQCREAVRDIYESPVTTKFVLGRMAEAMRDGKPFIVDEANALKPAVWLALHSYLTALPGDVIRINGDTITVQKGFCWILTGNPPDQYAKGRNKFDIATLSRIRMINYDYLPQEHEDSLDAILKKGDRDQKLLDQNELFTTMVVSMMESPLGLFLPGGEGEDIPHGMHELHNLARLAREIQTRFQKINLSSPIQDLSWGDLPTNIKEHTISPREIFEHILPFWKKSGFSQDLSYSLYFHFISGIVDKKEQFEIYFLAQQSGFFQSPGWPKAMELARDQNARNTIDIGRLVSRKNLQEYEKIEFPGAASSIWKLKNEYIPKKRFISDYALAKLLSGASPEIDFEEYAKTNTVTNENFLSEYETRIYYIWEQIHTVIGQITTMKMKSENEYTAIIQLLEEIQNNLEQISTYLTGSFEKNIPAMEILLDTIGEHIVRLSAQESIQGDANIMTTLTGIQHAISHKPS